MINLIVWILFGAFAGWIASMITKNDNEQGGLGNIIVGLLGALVGGFIMRTFGASGVTGFNLTSMIVAVGGAVLLLFVYNSLRHRKA